MKKITSLILALSLSAGLSFLAGCTTQNDGNQSCKVQASGKSSDSVKVSGAFAKTPQVKFPTPLKVSKTERREILASKGEVLKDGQVVTLKWVVYNGTTGKEIIQNGYRSIEKYPDVAIALSKDNIMPGILNGLKCSTVESRIALVVPPKDAFGKQGNPELSIAANDSLVFIVDVIKVALTRAKGETQPQKSQLPQVVLGKNGEPGITIPSGDAPKKLEVATLIKGNGQTVDRGDSVTVHYTGVLWDTKKSFDSSWTKGKPATFVADDGAKTQGGVIKGFAEALISQKVGSQVIAVIPPSEGYGDQASGPIPAHSTLVFVVDILDVQKPVTKK